MDIYLKTTKQALNTFLTATSIATPTSCDSISNMNTKDQDVFEGFLRLFVETIGHYKDFVTECKDSKGKSEFDV